MLNNKVSQSWNVLIWSFSFSFEVQKNQLPKSPRQETTVLMMGD